MKKLSLFFVAMCVMLSATVAQVSVWDGTHTTWTNGAGTETNPYLIENAAHLAHLAYYVNNGTDAVGDVVGSDQYWKLTIDIDLNSLPWTPIGFYYYYDYCYKFGGNFDGNGHPIANLVTNDFLYSGLFGYMNGGSVKNIGIVGNSSITGGISGIIGFITGTATIDNCYNTGTVSSCENGDVAGGIIGGINGNVIIIDCYNTGIVSASTAGGIVGYIPISNSHITINNCYNIGAISSLSDATSGYFYYTGGIVGSVGRVDECIITNCYNTGDISFLGIGGGILGATYADECIITNCYNTGDISTFNNANVRGGGIAGYADGGVITNCYNIGNIFVVDMSTTYNNSSAGGIVGSVAECVITNCYNTGDILLISAYSCYACGILGYLFSYSCTITNCYNTGNVSYSWGDDFYGGYGITLIWGGDYNVSNSYYLEGSAGDSGGGIVQTASFMKSQAFVDLLNNGPEPNAAYKLDVDIINYGFPLLKWQLSSPISPIITTTSLPNGVIGATYNAQLEATGTAPITWALASGVLPTGLTLSTEGVISGTPTTTGTSTFTVQATNNIGSDTKELTIKIEDGVGIVETHCNASLQVYPNPTTGELRIEVAGQARNDVVNVAIFDVFGRQMSQISRHCGLDPQPKSHISNQIDISHLPAGVYFVKIRTEAGEVVRKVVKE